MGASAGTDRTALYVYPGDFERRGLINDGDSWEAALDGRTETQYIVAGARVVWQHRTHGVALDADQRVTFAVTNLIQSTSAVIDLTTGEIVEVSGYYPNGAREEALGASEALGGGGIPFEVAGFTGKEADEEVGLTYFGERYLVQRLGRWATPDPLSVHAAGGGEALNAYHYVSGNLLQARDPLGLDPDQSVPEGESSSAPPAAASENEQLQMSIDASAWQFETPETPGMSSVCASSDCRTGTQSDAQPRNVPTRRQISDAHRRGVNTGMKNAALNTASAGMLGYSKDALPPEGQFHPDTPQAAEQKGYEAGYGTMMILTVGAAAVAGAMHGSLPKSAPRKAPTVMGDEGAISEGAAAARGSVSAAPTISVGPRSIGPSALTRTETLRSQANVKRFAQSMKASGWQGPPIKVFEHNGTKYILDGHHRAAAARQAGIDVVYESVGMDTLRSYGYRSVDELIWSAAEAGGR